MNIIAKLYLQNTCRIQQTAEERSCKLYDDTSDDSDSTSGYATVDILQMSDLITPCKNIWLTWYL